MANAQSEARHATPALPQTAIRDLRPFTHAALIPVGADLSSIRFQGVKVVTIATKSRTAADQRHCDEVALRDPGGSLYCPFVQPEAFTRAYQVTYSFDGEPLTSDTGILHSVCIFARKNSILKNGPCSQGKAAGRTLRDYFE
jgi:hypothetical protein